VNEHEAGRESASVAVHVTVVVPSGKDEPDTGEHTVVTGALPPVTTGASKETFVEDGDVTSATIGHTIVGAASGGVVLGATELLLQPKSAAAKTKIAKSAVRENEDGI